MPSEHRRIVFTSDELRKALDAHLMQQQARLLPVGIVASAKLNGDQTKVVLAIHDRRADQIHTIEVAANHVAVALLRYCFANNVPLPKDAKKSLAIAGDCVALEIEREAGRSTIVVDAATKTRPARAGT